VIAVGLVRYLGVSFLFVALASLVTVPARAQSVDTGLQLKQPQVDRIIRLAQAQVPQTTPAPRRRSQADSRQEWAARLNANTVTVISGNPNGGYLYLAYDLSAVLDDGDNLRILPVVGKGAYANARDVLHLKGIDLGFSRTDVLKHLVESNELGRNIANRLTYIAKLYNEEMQILAGPGVEKLEDLTGKKVNFSDAGSGTQFSTRRIFKALGINAIEVNMGQGDAYELLKKGEIAATVLISAKPSGSFRRFKLFEGAKMLSVPYTPELEADYFPAVISHSDYPDLVPEGEEIDTVAVGAVLISFNWKENTDRYRRVAKFVDAFFSNIAKFKQPPRHPKWRETNLALNIDFLKRFPRAQDLLDEIAKARAAAVEELRADAVPAQGIDPELARAQAARAAPNDPLEQERLFNKFMDWVRTQQN